MSCWCGKHSLLKMLHSVQDRLTVLAAALRLFGLEAVVSIRYSVVAFLDSEAPAASRPRHLPHFAARFATLLL